MNDTRPPRPRGQASASIVERLRMAPHGELGIHADTLHEAADEIERLRGLVNMTSTGKEIIRLKTEIEQLREQRHRLGDEIERLRAALMEIWRHTDSRSCSSNTTAAGILLSRSSNATIASIVRHALRGQP